MPSLLTLSDVVGTGHHAAVAARALYESAGFTNRERGPQGPRMLYYERTR
jgi:hypothetical protein